MTAEGKFSSSTSTKKRWKLVSLFWHSDHQREKELWVCGWKGHFFSQLDEVSAVSLQLLLLLLPQVHTPFLLKLSPSIALTSSFIFPLYIMLFHFKIMDSSVLSFLDSPTLTSIHDYWTTWTHDFYLKIRREMRDSGTGIQKWLLSCRALAFNVPIDSDLKWWLRSLPCGLTGSWIHAGWRAEWQHREIVLLLLPPKKNE